MFNARFIWSIVCKTNNNEKQNLSVLCSLVVFVFLLTFFCFSFECAIRCNVIYQLEKLTFETKNTDRSSSHRMWRNLLSDRSIKVNSTVIEKDNVYSLAGWTTFSRYRYDILTLRDYFSSFCHIVFSVARIFCFCFCCLLNRSKHCTESVDSFFVDCACNVKTYSAMSDLNTILLPDITSYQLNRLNLSQNYNRNDVESYKSMQKYICESSSISQNDILCEQDKCPSDMSLTNFISFGSMKRHQNL